MSRLFATPTNHSRTHGQVLSMSDEDRKHNRALAERRERKEKTQ